MKLTTVPLVGLLTLLAGCGVGSVEPLHQYTDLLFDPHLVGTWEDSDGATAVLTADDAAGYRLVMPGRSGKTESFRARLGQLGARRVLDVEPDLELDVSDEYKSLLLPLHGFVFLEIRGESLHWAMLDSETLLSYLERNPTAIPHVVIRNRFYKTDQIVLTASSSELQRFLTSYLDRPDVLGEASVLQRKGL